MPKKKKGILLVVDFANTVYRAVYAHQHLSFAGKPTGGLYGFVQQVTATIAQVGACSGVLVCADSPPYHRAKALPIYKGDRKRDLEPEALQAIQIAKKQVVSFLEAAEIPLWQEPGQEADDLIYAAAARAPEEWNCGTVIVRSSDTDLYQLFELPARVMFTRKDGLYTRADFRREFGVDPAHWPEVAALEGGHNGLPGVPGVGKKRAISAINGGRFAEFTAAHPGLPLWVRLARLPYKRVKSSPPYDPCAPLRRRAAERFLLRHGIQLNATIRLAFGALE